MITQKTWLLRELNHRGGCSVILRFIVCGIAGVLNGIALGFQGNGNLVPSGLFLGFILGIFWSVLLLFGPLVFVQRVRPPVQFALWVMSLLFVLGLLGIICFNIWK